MDHTRASANVAAGSCSASTREARKSSLTRSHSARNPSCYSSTSSGTCHSRSRRQTSSSSSSVVATNQEASSSPPTKRSRSGATSLATRSSPQRPPPQPRPAHPGRQLSPTSEETGRASRLSEDNPVPHLEGSVLVAFEGQLLVAFDNLADPRARDETSAQSEPRTTRRRGVITATNLRQSRSVEPRVAVRRPRANITNIHNI